MKYSHANQNSWWREGDVEYHRITPNLWSNLTKHSLTWPNELLYSSENIPLRNMKSITMYVVCCHLIVEETEYW